VRPGGRSPRSSGEGGRLPARERPSAPPTPREAFDLLVVPTVVLAAVVVAGVVAVVA
jgi:hypothetical protein